MTVEDVIEIIKKRSGQQLLNKLPYHHSDQKQLPL
jgi:hypothetical protein